MELNNEIREISSIEFGLYSEAEILKISVCKIDNPKKQGYGTVYDERMGTTDSSKICETCGQNAEKCPGHFGHIELNEPIIHPLFYKRVISFLNCFCMNCHRLIILKEQIYIDGLNKYKGETRFTKIQEKIKKVDMCCHSDCNCDQPLYKFMTAESTVCKIYESKDKGKSSVPVSVYDIKKLFDNISKEDIELIGFDSRLVHPSCLIITVLPVLPICDRPFVKADGNICDDDLTNQYVEIIKANNNIVSTKKKDMNETSKQKFIATLRFRILTTFNNGQGKAKHTTNGRAIKGIKERLAGKEGQFRTNIMGKRCNQSGRSVIGPDPTLKFGEIAVPEAMANILTVPVSVTEFNIEKLQKLCDNGRIDSVLKNGGTTRINIKRYRKGTKLIQDDVIKRGEKEIVVVTGREPVIQGDVIIRNGQILDKLLPQNRPYPLEIGSVVERKLQDGDWVLLNRQPTLHKASMLGMQVKVKPHRTIRMNLAVTKPFNADFDGDEMNIHVPQSIPAMKELEDLTAAKHNIISPQSSKPNVAIVQDSLLGAYRMTLGWQKIKKEQYFNISMKLDLNHSVTDRIEHINKIYKQMGKDQDAYCGRGIISLFLPIDLNYTSNNDGMSDEPTLKIFRGVLYEGALTKQVIGSAHNSLIQIIFKEYGPDGAAHFIDCVQFSTNEWNMIRAFTVGLGDCLITNPKRQEEIQDVIQKCYIEADGIKSTTTHRGIQELRVNAALNKAKDIGLRIAKDSLNPDNNFLSTVISGSKGDFFNIAQITGLLGQQNLRGKRVPFTLNNQTRTLPHYPFGELNNTLEYEARGFIASSFINGLNPREFYFHAMSGREGISDTAMGTATSGYMQRRIIKLTEDIKILHDGTVRDAYGNIYQMVYGENGFDPTSFIKVKGEHEICNIERIADKLNTQFECA